MTVCSLNNCRTPPLCPRRVKLDRSGTVPWAIFGIFRRSYSELHLCFLRHGEAAGCWFWLREEEGSSGTGNTSRFPWWEALLVWHRFTEEKHNGGCYIHLNSLSEIPKPAIIISVFTTDIHEHFAFWNLISPPPTSELVNTHSAVRCCVSSPCNFIHSGSSKCFTQKWEKRKLKNQSRDKVWKQWQHHSTSVTRTSHAPNSESFDYNHLMHQGVHHF